MKKIIIICGAFAFAALLYRAGSIIYKRYTPIKVGILHSLTGHMASGERPVVDATLFAIEEINANGGLLGRRIEPIVADGASDAETFAQQAEILITEKKVDVIFGCWTSASRKEVKNVIEKYNNLLFYPVQYEGVEQSSNIIYTGSTPNQQLFAALTWCMDHIGNRFFIVGSDYIYPRITGIIARALLDSVDAVFLGEEYIPLASKDVDVAIEKIKQARPDVIINMINGQTNLHFFKALRSAGITSDIIPTMSFSIGEPEIKEIGASLTAGDYASWSYFQTIDNRENKRFIEAFKKRYGQDAVINDPMEAAYFGVYLWFQAVNFIGSSDPLKVVENVQNQSRVAPEGIIAIDGYNHHTWKYSRIGKINADGQFDIVWSSKKSIYPVPFPFKTPDEWDGIMHELYAGWGDKWSK